MRKATINDMDKVVDILSVTFLENPGVNWLFGEKGNRLKKIRRLMEYAFIKSLVRDGVYISDNEKGAALCYLNNRKSFSVNEIIYEIKFAVTALSLCRISKVLKREAYRNKMRPPSGNYFYFWFFGVLHGGGGAGRELFKAIVSESEKTGMPVYLETAIDKNHRVYERFGFETYHYREDENENIKFWFMKREPESGKIFNDKVLP